MNGKLVGKNYKVITIVTMLAVFLWLMVKLSKNYDYAFDIPLRIVNNNPELCLKYPVPPTVRVVFVGRGSDLIRLNFYDIEYVVDISEVKQRLTLNLPEYPGFVQFPEEISVGVKSVLRPQELTIELDQCAERKVPVQVKHETRTADGYTLVRINSQPDSVIVSGPVIYVDTLKNIPVEKKTFRNVSVPFSEKFKVVNNSAFYAQFQPAEIEVNFDIQRLAEKQLENVPVEVINTPADYDVVPLPSFVKVYIKGGEKVLAGAEPQNFRVVIDFRRDWRRGKEKVKASIETNLNILYAETIPSQFELILQKKRNSL